MTGLDVFFRYSKKPLPYDAELEYITNDGQVCIDTGIKLTGNNGQGVIFKPYKATGSMYPEWIIFTGTRQGFAQSLNYNATPNSAGNIQAVADYFSGGYLGFGRMPYTSFTKIESKINLATSKIEAYTNDVFRQSKPIVSGQCRATATFFYAQPEWRISKMSISRYWITNADGEKIGDWIPVMKDDVPCFYDLVTETFFYKKGPGSFIPGPVKTIK